MISSLKETVTNLISSFLAQEGFVKCDHFIEGVLNIIDLISDYSEEGKSLYPEILISNDIESYFQMIPNKILFINEADINSDEFKTAVKLCAPLAVNNWIIYIDMNYESNRMQYGIVSSEMDETSPSIYTQAVGDLKVEDLGNIRIAYIKNIGQKIVEVAGLKDRLVVSLNLATVENNSVSEIHKLSQAITRSLDETIKLKLKPYLEKIFDQAFKEGHGNLIGIVEDGNINILKDKLTVTGGVFLRDPIDFGLLTEDLNPSAESSVNLRGYSSLLKSMLNHDGIVILTNKAKVIGYHLLIDGYLNENDSVNGGSRSKAFIAMKNCKHFEFCFYKSQDGNIKTWKNE